MSNSVCRALGIRDAEILGVCTQLLCNDSGRNEDGGKERDRPEDAQRNGYRPQRIVRLVDDWSQGVISHLDAGAGEAGELASTSGTVESLPTS